MKIKRITQILILVLITISNKFSVAQNETMMYADSSRRGVPFSKDPCVIRFGGRFLLYSSLPGKTGNSVWEIGIAESIDLIHWRSSGIIQVKEPYEKNGICAPCALVKTGQVHIFYQTYGNGKKDAICHAWSTDGIHFTRNATNPIFHPDGNWNCGRAIDADVIPFNGKYYLYYATRDGDFKIQMQGVALAPGNTSFNREEWTNLSKDGPILKPELPWERNCIEAASVINKNGELFMFYAGGYNNAPQQIGVAKSSDGLHWTRLSDQPFLPNGKPGEWNSSESGHPHIFDDGKRTFLFYQGNNDNGNTWWISNTEVLWNKKGPFLNL